MENFSIKKSQVALAVAAALSAGAAQAGDIAGVIAAATGTYVAPAKTIGASGNVTPTLTLGKKLTIVSAATTTLAAANTGSVEYYATFYDAAGKYLGAQLVGTDTKTAGIALTPTAAPTLGDGLTTVEGAAAGATKVALVVIPLDPADDVGGTTKLVGLLSFQSGGANLDTKMGITVTKSTKTATAANLFTAGDFGTVGAVPSAGSLAEEVAATAVALDAGYTGPSLASVTKNGLTDATVTTNVGIGALPATSIVTSLRTLSAVDGSATGEAVFVGDGATTPGNVAAGARGFKLAATDKINAAATATAAADFINQYAKLEVLNAGGAIADLAGNLAPNDVVDVARTALGKPAVAPGTGTSNAVVSATNITNPNLVKLYAGSLVAADFAGRTATVQVRLNEAVQLPTAVSNTTDIETVATLADTKDADRAITIAPAYLVSATAATTNASGATVSTAPAGAFASGVQITLNLATMLANAAAQFPDKTFTFKANAAGELVINDGTTDTNVTVALNYVAALTSPVTAARPWSVVNTGTAMAAAGDSIAATKIKMGVVPNVKLLTSDSDVDGFLDGIAIDTDGLVLTNGATDLAAATGVTGTGILVKSTKGATPVDLAATVDASSATKLVVKLTTPAGMDWNGSGSVNAADTDLYVQPNFNTSLTVVGTTAGTQILFDPQVAALNNTTPSALKYKAASSAITGGALPLFNVNAAVSGSKALSQIAGGNFDDGAPPVVIQANYRKSGGTGLDTNTKAEFGDVELVASEGLSTGVTSLGDIYIDGKAWTLANLVANLTEDPVVDNTNSGTGTVLLKNVPATVATKVVSLAFAGSAEAKDGVQLDLVVKPGLTIAAPLNDKLRMTKAEAKSGYLLGNPVDTITVTYDQADVAWDAAALAADKDGVFQVRATVGTLQNSTGGISDVTNDFTFSVPNAGVTFGTGANAGKITLVLADTNGKPVLLPGNSTAVYVDYSPRGTAKLVSATAKQNGVTNATLTSGDAEDDTGRFLDGVDLDSLPDNDDDTRALAEVKALSLFKSAHNSANFFTQTIAGTAKRGSANLPDFSQIRVDVVRVGKTTTSATFADPGRVGDGSVVVARTNQDQTGFAVANKQEIALANRAVTVADLGAVAKDSADLAAAKSNLDKAVAVNSPDVTKLTAAYNELGIRLSRKWFTTFTPGDTAVATPSIQAFIEVTTGAGGKGTGQSSADNGATNSTNAADNNDASVGRTAILLRKLPNTVKNGTTTYEVSVNLANGTVTAVDTNATADSAIFGGKIDLQPAVIGKAGTDTPAFEVLDSTFGLVQGGKYQVVAAVPEAKLTDKSVGLDASIKDGDAFVLISALDPLTGSYALLNSAEKSFTSYTPFASDLKTAGKATIRNLDLEKVAAISASNGSWKLMGIPGTPARDAKLGTAPLDLARLFVTIDPVDGNVATLWDLDGDSSDQLFTLLDNAPTMAFQIGTVSKSSIGVKAGQGFAMNSAGYKRQNNVVSKTSPTAADVDLVDTVAGISATNLYVPLETNATVPSLAVKQGWSMVAVQKEETLAAFLARNASVDAVVIPDGSSGAVTYFKETGITPDLTVKLGGSMFVYAKAAATLTLK